MSDPSGPNSDRLYFGTVQLPGMTSFVRLADFVLGGIVYVVPPTVTGILQIGYTDDHYSDNGYWGHDDGTGDQCKGVGNAWIVITIIRSVEAIKIKGLELAQSADYFDFNGQGSGLAPDNSIPMISGKPTIVRVYLDAQSSNGSASALVDGTLTILTPVSSATSIGSLNGPIVPRPASAIQRSDFNQTLNFMIPASLSQGNITFELTSAGFQAGRFSLSFVDVPTLKVHSVLIHYTGVDYFGNPVDKQTTGFDVLTTMDFVLRTYPVSDITSDGCEVLAWDRKLAVAANFMALDSQIASMRAMSGTDDLYIGIIPDEAGCGGISGLGGGGTALFFAGTLENGTDASHEIGHAFGRSHSPGCLPAGQAGDTNYPAYSGSPKAGIGEYGVDTRFLTVLDQNNVRLHELLQPAMGFALWVSVCFDSFAIRHVLIRSFS